MLWIVLDHWGFIKKKNIFVENSYISNELTLYIKVLLNIQGVAMLYVCQNNAGKHAAYKLLAICQYMWNSAYENFHCW